MSRYCKVFVDGHRRSEHLLVAERALGRPLDPTNHVHHVNEIKTDNRPQNLVICEDAAYHRLLHIRTEILTAGGDPDIERLCHKCNHVKPREVFCLDRETMADGRRPICRECEARRRRGGAPGKPRLNPNTVRLIRQRREELGLTQQTLANEFGVSRGHIDNILNGKKWASVV